MWVKTEAATHDALATTQLPVWLEGDEIFTCDGEMRIHGTGKEKYFDCCWDSVPGRRNNAGCFPLHVFPKFDRGEMGYASAYRWHLTDLVSFIDSIRVIVEKGPTNSIAANYESIAFYNYLQKINDMKEKLSYYLLLLALPLLLGTCNARAQKKVTIETLLNEMTDKNRLAHLDDDFKTLQSSSYSREAVSKDEEGWFHNSDACQFDRVDTLDDGRVEYVLLDANGPGVIVRIWHAWHAKTFSMGTYRFYFDHSETPQIEGRIDEIISENQFVGTPFSQTTAAFFEHGGWFSGHNLYFPLPYAKHCKITYEEDKDRVSEPTWYDYMGDILYYQINYRSYSEGTEVETYQKGDWENGKYAEAIKQAKAKLEDPQLKSEELKQITESGRIAPDKSLSTSIEGSKAIKQFSLKINTDNMEQALRSTVICMTFDGKKTVWVPVGDFFGTGYKISPYQSGYSRVTNEREMTMWFPMPFKQSAQIAIHNHGEQDVEIKKMDIHTSDWKWDDKSLYFYANWRLYHDIATKEKQDVNFISIKGKGKHVGDALTLFNNSKLWWGEGDEKIYVDGESFPSHFGTGTEDYYGYAWCSVVNFSMPFLAQPCGEGNRSPGMSTMSRWRMLDVIPFNSSYHFDMELWHWDSNIKMDYAPTVFWYGTYDSKAEYTNNIEDVQIPVKLAKRYEAENFAWEKVSGGEAINEAFLSHEWSAQNHLLWTGAQEGDKLVTNFNVSQEQTGTLRMVFTNGPNYGAADVYLNDQLVFENLDFNNEQLGLKEYKSENIILPKGQNRVKLVARLKAKHADEHKIGLDYLMIEV
ncbi:MAG: DUF2961 domain-containing protein [Cytophagales bacterium]|nr:DUF2961 domain-containing protein [Cytophagales bacterium]